jgi:regulator of cell morphogenesis and NO signaling
MRLEPTAEGFQIGAADLGALLGMAPQDMQRLMRDGQITSLSEKGQDQDEGRYRITFRHRSTRVRLTVNGQGEVLLRTRTSVVPQPNGSTGANIKTEETATDDKRTIITRSAKAPKLTRSLKTSAPAHYRIQVPQLVKLAEMVEDLHVGDEGNPEGLSTVLRRLIDEVAVQQGAAEQVLFFAARKATTPEIEASAEVLRAKHVAYDRDIKRVRDITNEFTLPEGACESWATLYTGVSDFINDLTHHLSLEKEMLGAQLTS